MSSWASDGAGDEDDFDDGDGRDDCDDAEEGDDDEDEDDNDDDDVDDGDDRQGRLEWIADKLQEVSGTDYAVRVEESSLVNAWATGSEIVVTSTLEEMLDDDELASVVAHEIAHNALEHPERFKLQMIVLMKAVLRSGGLLQAVATGAIGLAADRFLRRTSESSADRLGQTIAARAGFDPEAAATALHKLDPNCDSGGGVFSSHPGTDRRIRRLSHR